MLGDNIRKIREEKGIGLNETARRVGITGGYLSAIERNTKNNVGMEVLEKIAFVLGVSVNDFFDKDSQPPLNDRDRKDIEKDLGEMMEEFREGTGDERYYNGVKLKEEDLDLIEAAMRIALEQIKIKNKELYTPKKYKKIKK